MRCKWKREMRQREIVERKGTETREQRGGPLWKWDHFFYLRFVHLESVPSLSLSHSGPLLTCHPFSLGQ